MTRFATTLIAGAMFASLPLLATAQDQAKGEGGFQPSARAFAEAYNAGNTDALMAMYADDAVVMPPGEPAVSGREALRTAMQKDMAQLRDAKLRLMIDEGRKGSSGDLGWHSGAYHVVGTDGTATSTGKYLEVWQRRNGKWQIIRDIWNSDREAKADMPGMQHDGMQHDGMQHDGMQHDDAMQHDEAMPAQDAAPGTQKDQ